ncbi:Pancreatic triacylglycerol lipase [Eumeta japonica]|uniref:Pancreatic triacylglycerol lipase n=1 Tax=Eumeta variegata TaxID=151549 RepID=A0A4C1UMN2_EUMVA|nr:Pancreatic triacylglycerol lipase [Eumeta japonica]
MFIPVLAVSAIPLYEEDLESRTYPRYIQMPDGEGNLHTVDLEAPVDEAALEEVLRNPERNQYFLYTRRNPTNAQTLIINDQGSIRASNFNFNNPVVFVAHGWLSKSETSLNPAIRDAYFRRSDTNVIIVDWRRLAMMDYVTAMRGVPAVGRGLGQFINFLHSMGLPYNNVHLVGFSLGSHLVGNAGRETGGRVARVTGLDPAGPLWTSSSERLRGTDGVYVEAIHTDGGYTVGGLGIGTAIAQADFFPNGGISQPGCLTNICNHNRAWELFAASVSYNHLIGNQCDSNLQITLNTCRGAQLHMGNDNLNKRGNGMFRLDTDRRYPY